MRDFLLLGFFSDRDAVSSMMELLKNFCGILPTPGKMLKEETIFFIHKFDRNV